MSKEIFSGFSIVFVAIAFLFTGCSNTQTDVETCRVDYKKLCSPVKQDGFSFAIFGDRTGGDIKEGTEVWQQAISQVNRMSPDFVYSVGDLVWGYHGTEKWLKEASDFNADNQKLNMPFYPVAGNHEVYWFKDKQDCPKTHHELDYETCFGPLWYAFEYRDCWFITLFSDEGDPDAGTKGYRDAKLQRFSDEQFEWLQSILVKAKDTEHVFVFLHHPRWKKMNYGDDWDKVHDAFVRAGNVSAVFAGHFHNSDFDEKDGIDYYVLGTTGGGFSQQYSLIKHHLFYWVNVKPDGYEISAVPVDRLLNPKAIRSETKPFMAMQNWNIDCEQNKMIEWELSTKGQAFELGVFNVVISDTWDESGDNQVRIRYLDENRKVIEDYNIKSKGPLLNTFAAEADKLYYLQISDEDVSFDNESPGNQGKIEGYLVTKDIRD